MIVTLSILAVTTGFRILLYHKSLLSRKPPDAIGEGIGFVLWNIPTICSFALDVEILGSWVLSASVAMLAVIAVYVVLYYLLKRKP